MRVLLNSLFLLCCLMSFDVFAGDDGCDWHPGTKTRDGGILTCTPPGGSGAIPIIIDPSGAPGGSGGDYLSSDVDPHMPYKAVPAPQKLNCEMSHYAAQPQKYQINYMNAYGYLDTQGILDLSPTPWTTIPPGYKRAFGYTSPKGKFSNILLREPGWQVFPNPIPYLDPITGQRGYAWPSTPADTDVFIAMHEIAHQNVLAISEDLANGWANDGYQNYAPTHGSACP